MRRPFGAMPVVAMLAAPQWLKSSKLWVGDGVVTLGGDGLQASDASNGRRVFRPSFLSFEVCRWVPAFYRVMLIDPKDLP